MHAMLSPSSADRWIHCPPSALLNSAGGSHDTVFTREGTLAHAVAELKARKRFLALGPRKYASEMKKLRADELWQEEMDGYTDAYIRALDEIYGAFEAPPHVAVEQVVEFGDYVPDGFGTADCLMIGGRALHIVDFKYGKGVPVSADDNPQLLLYALGALLAYEAIYDIDDVRMTIVQPRVTEEAHTFTVRADELLAWAETVVKPAAELAAAGEGEFREGDWCRFCAVRGHCRARANANLQAAKMEFREPPLLSDDEVAEALTLGARLKSWLSDLEEYALSASLEGREIPGYKAVEGRSVRAWTDPDAAFTAARAAGVPDEMLYERKPVTLAALEKIMGKKAFSEALRPYVTTPPGKPTLVPDSDRRPAITNRNPAEDDFGNDPQI